MTSAKPVPGPTPDPPVRSGELLRHLAQPSDTRSMLTVATVGLIAYAAFAVMVGFMVAFPVNLVVIGPSIVIVFAAWFF
ncbi:MAG: hypothetical protein ACRD0P_39565, partial [Stackebrandtia sp.]